MLAGHDTTPQGLSAAPAQPRLQRDGANEIADIAARGDLDTGSSGGAGERVERGATAHASPAHPGAGDDQALIELVAMTRLAGAIAIRPAAR